MVAMPKYHFIIASGSENAIKSIAKKDCMLINRSNKKSNAKPAVINVL
jgi:hypothetical protein